MILSLLLAADGARRFKTLEAWRYGFWALLWINIIGGLAQSLFYAGGTLEDPTGDGPIMAYVRQASNDTLVLPLGLAVLLFVYLPFFWLWIKAGRSSKRDD